MSKKKFSSKLYLTKHLFLISAHLMNVEIKNTCKILLSRMLEKEKCVTN